MSVRDVNSPVGSAPTNTPDTTESTNSSENNQNVQTRDPELEAIWNRQNKTFYENQSKQMRAEALLAKKGSTDGEYNTPNTHGGTKQAIKAFAAAGVAVPSQQTVNRTYNTLQNNPQMKQFTQELTQGITGENGASLGNATSMGTAAGALAGHVEKSTSTTPSSASESTPTSTSETSPSSSTSTSSSSSSSSSSSGSTSSDQISDKYINEATSIMAVMFVALAASLDEDNKIKMGRIKDLQKYNKISSLINNYIASVLQPAQEQLDKKTSGKKNTTNVTVPVATFDNVDPDVLLIDKNGVAGLSATGGTTLKRLSASGLSSALSTAQGWQTSASNNAEQMSNRYQSTDNHSNQTFTMLTGILKNINDSASNIGRNIA